MYLLLYMYNAKGQLVHYSLLTTSFNPAFADFVALDFSDVIAKDLVAAGLVEGKNLVVGTYQ